MHVPRPNPWEVPPQYLCTRSIEHPHSHNTPAVRQWRPDIVLIVPKMAQGPHDLHTQQTDKRPLNILAPLPDPGAFFRVVVRKSAALYAFILYFSYPYVIPVCLHIVRQT